MLTLSRAQEIRFAESFYVMPAALGGCWAWIKSLDPDGYGVFNIRGRSPLRAHRVSFEMLKGPIPSGMVPDHLCRFRACVNPEHLEAVTPAENNRRGNSPTACNTRKSHCRSGHEYNASNTYWRPGGGRGCRKCRLQAVLRYTTRQTQLKDLHNGRSCEDRRSSSGNGIGPNESG